MAISDKINVINPTFFNGQMYESIMFPGNNVIVGDSDKTVDDVLNALAKEYIVEQGKQLILNTNRYNYYEKYASGKLIQYGVANYSYTDGFGKITYPIPFSGSINDYMLFVQGQYISGKVVEVMVASKHSTSQGYAYSRYIDNSKPDTHDFDWYAIGKWK